MESSWLAPPEPPLALKFYFGAPLVFFFFFFFFFLDGPFFHPSLFLFCIRIRLILFPRPFFLFRIPFFPRPPQDLCLPPNPLARVNDWDRFFPRIRCAFSPRQLFLDTSLIPTRGSQLFWPLPLSSIPPFSLLGLPPPGRCYDQRIQVVGKMSSTQIFLFFFFPRDLSIQPPPLRFCIFFSFQRFLTVCFICRVNFSFPGPRPFFSLDLVHPVPELIGKVYTPVRDNWPPPVAINVSIHPRPFFGQFVQAEVPNLFFAPQKALNPFLQVFSFHPAPGISPHIVLV